MTTVWPVMVSVRHMVTTMSAQSSLSAGFFQERARSRACDLLGPEVSCVRSIGPVRLVAMIP
jgi:hypothetical protein